jgi:DNA-binding response OmpR family regulator
LVGREKAFPKSNDAGDDLMPRILIIDDDPDFRAMLYTLLTRMDYEVLEAENGDQGLRTARRESLDLAISDLVMPDKDGIETIRELRRSYPTLPIVAVSGCGRVNFHALLKAAKFLGASEILEKPFSREQLTSKIDAALKASHRNGAQTKAICP